MPRAAEAETRVPGASNSVTLQNRFHLPPKGTLEVGRHVTTTTKSAYMVSQFWLGLFPMTYYRENALKKATFLGARQEPRGARRV